jgi:hypothetical protein
MPRDTTGTPTVSIEMCASAGGVEVGAGEDLSGRGSDRVDEHYCCPAVYLPRPQRFGQPYGCRPIAGRAVDEEVTVGVQDGRQGFDGRRVDHAVPWRRRLHHAVRTLRQSESSRFPVGWDQRVASLVGRGRRIECRTRPTIDREAVPIIERE